MAFSPASAAAGGLSTRVDSCKVPSRSVGFSAMRMFLPWGWVAKTLLAGRVVGNWWGLRFFLGGTDSRLWLHPDYGLLVAGVRAYAGRPATHPLDGNDHAVSLRRLA